MLIEQPAKWLRWLYPRATWRMDPNERSVYITFDDGPIPESTPFILKTLREHNVKATFFMVGEMCCDTTTSTIKSLPKVIRWATTPSTISVLSSIGL